MTAKAAHELALAAKQEPTWYECINSIGCPHAFTCSLCSCMLTDTHTPSTFVYVSVSHTQASHTHKIVKRTKFACLLCALKKKKRRLVWSLVQKWHSLAYDISNSIYYI